MATARRTSQRVTLLMLVLASLTVLTLDYHGEASRAITHVRNGVADAFSPLQRGIAATLHPIGDVVSGSIHYGSLATENERLRSDLGAASERLAEENAAAESGKQLLALQGLPFVGSTPTVDAIVISPPTSNFESTVELDRGTSSGVGAGMPVVADGGLVGSVSSASQTTATVQLIANRSSNVGVENATGTPFAATGEGPGEPLSLSAALGGSGEGKMGDLLETSPQTSFPAGIPVAVVSAIHTSLSGATNAVAAKSVANLTDLVYVAVLQWLPAG